MGSITTPQRRNVRSNFARARYCSRENSLSQSFDQSTNRVANIHRGTLDRSVFAHIKHLETSQGRLLLRNFVIWRMTRAPDSVTGAPAPER
jgi:hypothetical protein